MGMCLENICGIVWKIYRDYGLVVGSKGENIKKVTHETKCLMGHFCVIQAFKESKLV